MAELTEREPLLIRLYAEDLLSERPYDLREARLLLYEIVEGYLATNDVSISPEFDANFAFLMALTTPIIAAVNGAAAGVGMAAMCHCDFRFAVPDARMTAAHGPLGLAVEFGMSWLLPRMIGLTRANDLLITSRKFTAAETDGWGLFNEIVDRDDLMPRVHEYARFLVEQVAPSALRNAKRQIYLDQHRDIGTAVREADALLERSMKEPDYREGVAAILEKRRPNWS